MSQVNRQTVKSTWQSLIGKLNTCLSSSERKALLDLFQSNSQATVVSFLNAHACNLALEQPDFYEAILNSDYLLRDGFGVELHLLLRRIQPGINLNGTDLIPEIIQRLSEVGAVSLFGAEPKNVKAAQDKLEQQGITVNVMDGYQSDEAYINHALTFRPKLIVIGMGMPKQEVLSQKLKLALKDTAVLIVNGGGIIDFMSGSKPRAPSWIRRIRLESLYRLYKEPKRLWKRNLGSVIFLLRSIVVVIKRK